VKNAKRFYLHSLCLARAAGMYVVMKKGFLISVAALALLLLFSTYALAENVLRIGYSCHDEITLSVGEIETTEDVDPGMDISYEFTVGESGLENGFGFEYQFQKTYTSTDGDQIKFQYIPIYGLINLNFAETEITDTYLVGKLGYSFFKMADLPDSATVKGGLYYALGLGMKIGPNLRTQVLYEVCNGSVSEDIISMDVKTAVYTLKCGFAF
jgi:hypothetical protein